MTTPFAAGQPAENVLRLTRCMRCGYSLESLPAEGVCPECGISYDQNTVVLYGRWSGRGDLATGSRGSIIAYSVLIGFIVLIALEGVRHGDYRSMITIGFWVTPFAAAMFWRFSIRRGGVDAAVVQCRFNSFGCLQCNMPEETVGIGDPRRMWRVLVLVAYPLFVLATINFEYRSIWIAGIAIMVFGAIIGTMLYRRSRRLAKAKAEVDPNAHILMMSAREQGIQVIATPWRDVASIRVGQFPKQTTRWHLASNRMGRFDGGQPINAEVDAEPAQIRELKARIAAWQEAARR